MSGAWDESLRGPGALRVAMNIATVTLEDFEELEGRGKHHTAGLSSRELLAFRIVLAAAKRAARKLPEGLLTGPPIRPRRKK